MLEADPMGLEEGTTTTVPVTVGLGEPLEPDPSPSPEAPVVPVGVAEGV